jgi:hypothetical protein
MTAARWVNDPGIAWRILLTAELADPPPRDVLAARLAALCRDQGWDAPPEPLVAGSPSALRALLATEHASPVLIGTVGHSVVISAHHSRADGIGLLQVLGALAATPVSAPARGVGDRPTTGGVARTAAHRLAEAVFRPQSRLTTSTRSTGRPDDMVEARVPGQWRTADVVHAAARGAAAFQTSRGRSARRITISVGAARPSPSDRIADRTALLRLRDVERLTRAQVAELLRTAPVQTPPVVDVSPRLGRVADHVVATGMRLLRPCLGSTLLVSHLGGVVSPGTELLALHPVTAGGSGVSVGSISLADRDETVISLRARAADRTPADGLERLLEAIVQEL